MLSTLKQTLQHKCFVRALLGQIILCLHKTERFLDYSHRYTYITRLSQYLQELLLTVTRPETYLQSFFGFQGVITVYHWSHCLANMDNYCPCEITPSDETSDQWFWMSNGFPPPFLFIWQKNGESAGKDKARILHTCDWMWACIDLRPLKWSCYGNLYCCCHWWGVWQVSLPNMHFFMLLAQGLWIVISRFFFVMAPWHTEQMALKK